MKHPSKFAPTPAASSCRRFSLRRLPAAYCALSACMLFALPVLAAQTTKPSPSIPSKPAAAQAPTPLANQPPTAATVTFQNGQLTVKAHNSTLLQILQSIAARTGMQVHGIPGNHRIFGTYGPGQPRQVISQLLSGFNFNYLLVGSSQNGAPQQLILAGLAATGPEPHPAQSIQPAPQDDLPRPQYHPSPFYQPRPNPPPRRRPSPRTRPQSRSAGQRRSPQRVRTPQEILKQLEAMRTRQNASQ